MFPRNKPSSLTLTFIGCALFCCNSMCSKSNQWSIAVSQYLYCFPCQDLLFQDNIRYTLKCIEKGKVIIQAVKALRVASG
jgi:hypothetical protein